MSDKPTLIQTDIDQNFTLKIDGKDAVIKMTFGRLNRICQLVGNINNVAAIVQDPEVQNLVLIELLSKSKSDRTDPDELDVAPEDISKLLAWAGVHVLDFFMKLASNFNESSTPVMASMVETLDRLKAKMGTMDQVQTSLTDGSAA